MEGNSKYLLNKFADVYTNFSLRDVKKFEQSVGWTNKWSNKLLVLSTFKKLDKGRIIKMIILSILIKSK